MHPFGLFLLESIPTERQRPLEGAYTWIADQLRERTNGKIDIQPCAVEHWFKGRRVPPGGTLGVLAEILGWSDSQTAQAVRLLMPAPAQVAA